MRIDLRDRHRRPMGTVEVDPSQRPVRVPLLDESGREVFLHWDSAMDDAGHLRRCLHCGCRDLFHEKAFPFITGVVVVLAFAGSLVGLLGFADRPEVQWVLVAVLLADVALFTFSKRRLVCYRCHTAYPGQPIARYHRSWDRSIADRHPLEAAPATTAETASDAARPAAPGTSDGGPRDPGPTRSRPDPARPTDPGDAARPAPAITASSS